MAVPQERGAPAWSVRLVADLDANDQAAKKLVAELTEEQLNWQPAPGSWSVGQCLEHLCTRNEAYLPPISVAVNENRILLSSRLLPDGSGAGLFAALLSRRRSPSELRLQRRSGPRRTLALPFSNAFSQETNPAGNSWSARAKNVNRIRFWNPFIPGIRFTVGTGLQIIVGHERRHLLQAERVPHSPSFPH
jgi:hypothetical protein